MKFVSIVGARPEFVQAAPVCQALKDRHEDVLVHTGQHYDYLMSQAFFDDLGLPAPTHNLGVGSGSPGRQTAEILTKLEETLLHEAPDAVIVRGDTNSTMAGALAATKLGLPVVHLEAGERSYDRRMPEEINRLVADSVADVHFCASQTAVRRLAAEGMTAAVHFVGDVMYDALLQVRAIAARRSRILEEYGLTRRAYALATIHRAGNTDDPERLRRLVRALNAVDEPVVFPVHPRTRAALERADARFVSHVRVVPPVGYLDMIALEDQARVIATDSGGVQREAYCLGVPCVTLRDETEWVETVEAGWNVLVGADTEAILAAWRREPPVGSRPPIFGDGQAAATIVRLLETACRDRLLARRTDRAAYNAVAS